MAEAHKAHILLMEDDPGLARLFEKRLARAGYRVDVARTGEEGLAMYDVGDYDILVTDQMMPGLTGLQVIEALLARGPLPPIIMVTGTGSEQIAVEAMKMGASDYIVKDVDGAYFDLLPTVIEHELQRHRLMRERERVEAALRESQRVLSTLMSNLPGIAYRCRNDPDWTMEFISDGCYELTGYEPSDLVDNRTLAYADLIHPKDRDPVWSDIQAAMQAGKKFQLEYRIITATGEEKWVWEQGTAVPGPGGDVVALEGFISDITERKRAEQERERLVKELETALAQVKTLRGLLPICANCKKIRDDEGYWHGVEAYVSEHSEARFSHGLCPDCMKELYPWFKPEEK